MTKKKKTQTKSKSNGHITPFLYKDSNIAVKPTTLVPNSFVKFGNESYKMQTMKMRWDEARKQCLSDDADLASILNPMTHAFVSLQVDRHNKSVWIGLNSNLVRAVTVHSWCLLIVTPPAKPLTATQLRQ